MDAQSGNVLPRRTAARPRRGGRHRSPDRISVPAAAPALVLAVPAAESPVTARVAAGVATEAAGLCPGAAISVGYAGGGPAGLAPVLERAVQAQPPQSQGLQAQGLQAQAGAAGEADGGGLACRYAAVLVPLALTPDAARDAFVASAAAQAGPGVMVAGQLGPHPVLGAALHDRLAEAGLVRPRRMAGLSLVTLDTGVLLAAAGGEDALPATEAAAIMLAARLGVPVAPACTGSPASVDAAAATLRRDGVTRLVLAPYLIGLEISAEELASVAAAADAECAAALGSHPAVGQLVTMSYGAALLEAGAPAPPGPGGGRTEGQAEYRTTPPSTDERSLPRRTSTSR
ncbi:MAG TPA: hypothetical protein VGM53_03015 [Streptosporangiaceae bacterium]